MEKKRVFPLPSLVRKKKIIYKSIHSYFEIAPEIIIVNPELTYFFFMRNIYRNTFFIWCLIVFLGLQKDRELFNASPFLTLIWSHSVIKSSLMVLFFRLSASRSFIFFFFSFIINFFFLQAKLPQPRGDGATPGQVLDLIYIFTLSLITHSILCLLIIDS